MNVHVFTTTSDLDSITLRAQASLLVHEATFVNGWRDVQLPPVDLHPEPPSDIAALDDFVHHIYEQDGPSYTSVPSPGRPRTRSELSHPFASLSQGHSLGYAQQQSVHHSTLFDGSIPHTRPSDALGSPSISGIGHQPSVFLSHPLSSVQGSAVQTSASNVLPPSIPSHPSFDTPQSIPIPPNQLELYARQYSLQRMPGDSQDSRYGSHELPSNGRPAPRPSSLAQQSSIDSLYTPSRTTASHRQSAPASHSLTGPPNPPSISQYASGSRGLNYDYSLMMPPNQAQLYATRSTTRQSQDSLYRSQQPEAGPSGSNRPLAHASSQSSLYGPLPIQGSPSNQPGFASSSSRVSPADVSARGTTSDPRPDVQMSQEQIVEEVLPGFVFTTPVRGSDASSRNASPLFDRHEVSAHAPALQRSNQGNEDEDPPGLLHLSYPSSTASHDLFNDRARSVEDTGGMVVEAPGEDDDEIPGLGSSWASLTQNEYLAAHYALENADSDPDRASTFHAHDFDSRMGESGMNVGLPAVEQTEEDEYAVEKDLTDTYGMRDYSFVIAREDDEGGAGGRYEELQETQPATPHPSSPDPLSGPSVHWDRLLQTQSAGSFIPPSQHSPQEPQASQHAGQDPSQQGLYRYTEHVSRASPAPSAYLSGEQDLARQRAREVWGDQYDTALAAAYGRGHSQEDPFAAAYADLFVAPVDDGAVASQDSRAADFPDDESPLNPTQGSQLYHTPPQNESHARSSSPYIPASPSRANPNSPYIPARSLTRSQSQPRHAQPGQHSVLAAHLLRLKTINPNTSFRPRTYRPPRLPPLPGEVVHLAPASQYHPRRPSDTVVPDSQEAENRRRRRIEWPESLESILPSPHFYTIPIRRYVPSEPTPQESYRPSQDSIYASNEQPSPAKDKGKGKEKAGDEASQTPRPDPFAIPNPLLYPLPASQSSQSSQPLLPEQTRKQHSSDPQPSSLPPFTSRMVRDFLTAPTSRCAWILPVRGTPGARFRWGVTSANVLVQIPPHIFNLPSSASASPSRTEPSETIHDWWPYLLPSSPSSESSLQDAPGCITWTADALRALWKFLLQVREARRVGLVGLAYVLADPPVRDIAGRVKTKAAGAEDPLAEVDYIKVHLDARYAMQVRELLHYWRYKFQLPPEVVEVRRQREKAEAEAEEQERAAQASQAASQDHEGDVEMEDESKIRAEEVAKKRKGKAEPDDTVASFRMFRGAKLVLLDERNQAVLTC